MVYKDTTGLWRVTDNTISDLQCTANSIAPDFSRYRLAGRFAQYYRICSTSSHNQAPTTLTFLPANHKATLSQLAERGAQTRTHTRVCIFPPTHAFLYNIHTSTFISPSTAVIRRTQRNTIWQPCLIPCHVSSTQHIWLRRPAVNIQYSENYTNGIRPPWRADVCSTGT
jgi:hypothetical protein